jgi:hypothetical protein
MRNGDNGMDGKVLILAGCCLFLIGFFYGVGESLELSKPLFTGADLHTRAIAFMVGFGISVLVMSVGALLVKVGYGKRQVTSSN